MNDCQTDIKSRAIVENISFVTISRYLELTKPSILIMTLVTTSLGFFLGTQEGAAYTFIFTLLGVGCACGGAGVLNHYIERDIDKKMRRTKNRPIPQGFIDPWKALVFGILLITVGASILLWKVNILSCIITILSALLYVLVYTPLKLKTWWNTPIGAIPGALPPVIGWAAATGNLEWGGWILFAILFTWQHPHFYAIAWIYREDYSLGGFQMLPIVVEGERRTLRQVMVYSILMLTSSLLPTIAGITGIIYFCGALFIGLYFLKASIEFVKSKNGSSARGLLKASVIYLPLLLIFLVVDILIM